MKVKVKVTLVQALRLCKGPRPIGEVEVKLYSFMTTTLEGGEGSASRPGRSLPLGKTRCPLFRSLGGPQDRSGQVRKISPPTGIQSLDRPSPSQALFQIRYPAHQYPRTLQHLLLSHNVLSSQYVCIFITSTMTSSKLAQI